MIKDRAIKQRAMQYAFTRRWYPHMEVEVAPPGYVARRVSLVTDVDVLAVAPAAVFGSQAVLFDCKTKAAESGANRALWLRGLLDSFDGEKAFCVLKKSSIDSDHRKFAQDLGVILIPDDEFDVFAKVSAGRSLDEGAAVTSLVAWDRLGEVRAKFPALVEIFNYRNGTFWRGRRSHAACRKLVAHALERKAEFDPSHIAHEALLGDLVSLFALALSDLVASIFGIMLLPASKGDFEEAVRLKLYGGRDEYEQQNRLFKLLKEARHGSASDDLVPPEWDRFLKMFRQLLDEPNAVARSALVLKEAAFSLLVEENRLSELAFKDPQAVRFAVLIADYFYKAVRLPPEFLQRLEARLLPLS